MAGQPDVDLQTLRKRTPEGQAQVEEPVEQKSPRLGFSSSALPQQLSLTPSPALQAQLGSGLRLTQPGSITSAGLAGQSVIREQQVPLQALFYISGSQLQGTDGSKTVPRLAIGGAIPSQPAAAPTSC